MFSSSRSCTEKIQKRRRKLNRRPFRFHFNFTRLSLSNFYFQALDRQRDKPSKTHNDQPLSEMRGAGKRVTVLSEKEKIQQLDTIPSIRVIDVDALSTLRKATEPLSFFLSFYFYFYYSFRLVFIIFFNLFFSIVTRSRHLACREKVSRTDLIFFCVVAVRW